MDQDARDTDEKTTPVDRPRSPDEVAAALERARALIERYIPAGGERLSEALIRDRRAENE